MALVLVLEWCGGGGGGGGGTNNGVNEYYIHWMNSTATQDKKIKKLQIFIREYEKKII